MSTLGWHHGKKLVPVLYKSKRRGNDKALQMKGDKSLFAVINVRLRVQEWRTAERNGNRCKESERDN